MQYSQTQTPGIFISSANHEEGIAQCLECFRACSELIPHEMNLVHIRLLSACALLCETAAKAMMLEAEVHPKVCALCAEICLQTALSCEEHAEENRQALECARTCRRCAKTCRQISQA